MNKKIYIIAACLFAVLTISATVVSNSHGDWEDYEPQNLKVLPQDISGKTLGHIMDSFKKALGVKCSFCHALKEDGKDLDFVSDENPHKNITRGMMVMVQEINGKYFKNLKDKDGNIQKISCISCHNGNKTPQLRTVHKKK